MVLARFLPRDEQFFTHFADSAKNALEMAQLLVEVIEFGPDTERKVRRLRDLEHQGDDITHRIYQALNSTFVTPLDREDIRHLASALDDFVDGLEEAGKRIWLYQMGAPTESVKLFARVLVEQSQLLADNIPHLEEPGKRVGDLQRCALELHRLENEADDALSQVLAELFDGVTEVPELITAIRWGEIYHLLEDATDMGENIGHTLEGILGKYA
jgi:predicted phosphate transport protein (TIGR00153 family)